jgi:hypothetical protein
MRDLETLPLRDLQKLSARVLSSMIANNNNIWQFNQHAHHDSQKWYKTVIKWYIEEYGGWPDEVGPGKEVRILYQ